jgi:hypothetical protein
VVADAWWEWTIQLAVWGFLAWCLVLPWILALAVGLWRLIRRLRHREPEPGADTWADAWQVVQADDYGTLWQARWPVNHHRVVEVVDATPRPDGSLHRYRIRVPPNMRTAREAIAWTFGFDDPAQYTPSAET